MEGQANSILGVILIVFIVALIFCTAVFIAIRLWLKQDDIKRRTTATVFYLGEKFTEHETFNCNKKKVAEGSQNYSLKLTSKRSLREFYYDERFAIKQKSTGKTGIFLVEVGGTVVPILPFAVINTEVTKDAEGKVTGTKFNVTSYFKTDEDAKKTFEFKDIKDKALLELKSDFDLYKVPGKKNDGMFTLFLIIGGIIIVGGIIMFIISSFSKKK